jgi:pimeloyl-ACP methyl ester carboxylesterase
MLLSTEKIKSALESLVSARGAELPHAVEASANEIDSSAGKLFIYEDLRGDGAPAVLVHGLDFAASSYEMRPLFMGLAGSRPVVTFDLPGFGLSSHDPRLYDRDLYIDAITTVLDRCLERHRVAADLVALGKSAELAATVALRRPELVRSLVLLCPTGLAGRGPRRPAPPIARSREFAAKLLENPLFAAPAQRLLALRPVLGRTLRSLFAGRIDRGLAAYARLTLARPGALLPQAAALRGELDGGDPFALYERLSCPVLVVYDEAKSNDYALLAGLESRAGWKSSRIGPTRALPQFEHTGLTLEAMRAFYAPLDLDEARMRAASRYQRGWGVS